MKLSILIATVNGREWDFMNLVSDFKEQIKANKLHGDVEIVTKKDNKEISIGSKRQLLLEEAKGDFIVFFDDDDKPYDTYLTKIMEAIKSNPDCVGMLIHMTTNNQNPKTCCHSLKYKLWMDNVDGYNYVRNVTHFNPVKRELALIAGFNDMRFGEDKDYSDRLTSLCKTEVFINEKIFHYRYKTNEQHNKKYGIR